MATQLFIAPAASGKTRYLTQLARDASPGVRVCVSTSLQARDWRLRLANLGGALGVRVQTLDDFYADCLNAAGIAATRLSAPVQYRLLQTIAAETPLTHYAELRRFPGFIHLLQDFIAMVKGAGITPDAFAAGAGAAPRLQELAEIYARYQTHLHEKNWADAVEMGLLATTAATHFTTAESLLLVDGFDNFNAVQLSFLAAIAPKVPKMVITLTGQTSGTPRPLVHQRFDKTRHRVETTFNITAEPLPEAKPPAGSVPAQLEAKLFASPATPIPNDETLSLIEASDRPTEVRAALRRLKAAIVLDGVPADRLALLARHIETYLPHIRQIAAEFGVPIRVFKPESLRANPLIAALLNLLRLSLPLAANSDERAFPYRLTLQAWRAPYFDWSAQVNGEPVGIAAGDAVVLDAIARYGQVLGGEKQWRDAIALLKNRRERPRSSDELLLNTTIPSPEDAAEFAGKFERFVHYLTPPATADTFAAFVRRLETLIGDDQLPTAESLRMVARARAEIETAARDVAALRALKEVLRGLVWAEQHITPHEKISYPQFFAELVGAIDAAQYTPPAKSDSPAILVADAVAVRGLAFHTVAVLGMAEGEFPAVLKEDPLLRDADRKRLNDKTGAHLPLSIESDEVEFFYETITRPWAKLILTRPRLADNGAEWQASAYWEEVRKLVAVQPEQPPPNPPPAQAASWGELLAAAGDLAPAPWMHAEHTARLDALAHAAEIFVQRRRTGTKTHFDGDLTADAAEFSRKFSPENPWSASRLESYRACPFMFFVGSVLGLEPRGEPLEGLDARQLGNIYHHIFEELYSHAPTDLSALLARLPTVAKTILDAAPAVEGFRETAWWSHTRDTIEQNVRVSLEKLADIAGDFIATHTEKGFFGTNALTVRAGADYFRIHGLIDRVDELPDGTIRIIDYKTSSPYGFDNGALLRGKKLQLPLYALAARDALKLGDISDGFYWHIRQAKPSNLTLAKFKTDAGSGAEAAIAVAVAHAWEAIRSARDGHFMPHPPADGCPSFCPAAGFCWHYQPGFGG